MHPELPMLLKILVLLAILGAFIFAWFGLRRQPVSSSPSSTNTNASETLFALTGRGDQLTQINGIGAVLETKLNGLGIDSFEQIAQFSESDIARVNEVLDFKGRIERDDWVSQAKRLITEANR